MTRAPRIPGHTTRRTVVAATGAVGLAAALAACGSDDTGGGSSGGSDGGGDTGGGNSGGDAPDGGTELAKTSEIPEGGGTVFTDQKVVVVQPAAGEFRAYSSICTHAGCQVSEVKDGTINCACHGSRFRLEDGEVKDGPAMQPLPAAENVTVEGDSVRLS